MSFLRPKLIFGKKNPSKYDAKLFCIFFLTYYPFKIYKYLKWHGSNIKRCHFITKYHFTKKVTWNSVMMSKKWNLNVGHFPKIAFFYIQPFLNVNNTLTIHISMRFRPFMTIFLSMSNWNVYLLVLNSFRHPS